VARNLARCTVGADTVEFVEKRRELGRDPAIAGTHVGAGLDILSFLVAHGLQLRGVVVRMERAGVEDVSRNGKGHDTVVTQALIHRLAALPAVHSSGSVHGED
jgi:hypothetical protein